MDFEFDKLAKQRIKAVDDKAEGHLDGVLKKAKHYLLD